MFEIIKKEILAPAIKLFQVSAPDIAAKAQPGQFIILRMDEKGERIPLTIADFDRKAGILTLIFQEVGRSTKELGELNQGDCILDLVGPLGKPSEIKNFGQVICIGGGVGAAPVYPITRAMKQAGNEVISIIGARTGDLLILTEDMQQVSDSLYIVTDDGSAGMKGFVTTKLQEILTSGPRPDLIVAIGPLIMMQAVSELTRPYQIKTVVSLNPIMVDGTGMCGACRVPVGNEIKFACVDGPEFDGHQVDWSIAMMRAKMFKEEEKIAMDSYHTGGGCRCQKQK